MSTPNNTGSDRSVRIGKDALGNTIVTGDENKITIYQTIQRVETEEPSVASIDFNPYLGLGTFQEKDADRFFGREKLTKQLWVKLRDLNSSLVSGTPKARLLPIIGPSGSGKSSLARAGLIPALARNPLPGLESTRIAVLTPGTNPLEALAGVMARIATNDTTPVKKTGEFLEVLGDKNKDEQYRGLQRIANLLPDIEISPLVILVDQFEEVYSLCKDKYERRVFVENLLYTACDSSGRVSVILTLRSDFLGDTQAHEELNICIAKQGVIVPAMSEAELHDAIYKPAANAGRPLPEHTIDKLITQTKGREGALPLLQFALTRIWDGLTEGVEPAETLREIGGVGGALAGEAQRLYDRLNDDQKIIARRAFMAMVQLGEGTRDTRRGVRVEDVMVPGEDGEQVLRVLSMFSGRAARLITLSSDESGVQTAEVSHEALLEHWHALNTWLDGSRDDLRFQRRMNEAAVHWENEARQEGLLWRPPDLDLLIEYQQRKRVDMSQLQIAYFEASSSAEKERIRERGKQQKRVWVLAVILTVLLAVAIAFANYANFQRLEADRQSQTARALQLAAQSELTRNRHIGMLEESVLLGVESMKLASTVEAGEVIQSGLVLLPKPIMNLSFNSSVNAMTFSADDRYLITGSSDHTATVWDIETGQEFLGVVHTGAIEAVSFHPQSQYLATGGRDGRTVLWRFPSGEEVYSIRNQFSEVETGTLFGDRSLGSGVEQTIASVNNLSFSNDGQYLAIASEDTVVMLIHIPSLELRYKLTTDSKVSDVSFSPNDEFLAALSGRGVLVWEVSTGKKKLQLKTDADDLEFDPMGRYLATANRRNRATLWNIQTGERVSEFVHEGRVSQVSFSRDGKSLWSTSADNTVRRWDVTTECEVYRIQSGGWVRLLTVSPDGEYIATTDFGHTARLWKASDGAEIARFSHEHQISHLTFGHDSKQLATSSKNGTTRLWELQGASSLVSLKHSREIDKFAFSEDEALLITSEGFSGGATVWKIPHAERIHYEPFQGIGNDAAISRDRRSFITTSKGTVRFRDIETAEIVREIELEGIDLEVQSGYSINKVSFSPNGRYLIKDYNGQTSLWELEEDRGAKRMDLSDDVYRVAFSPDNLHLVTVGRSNSPLNSVVEVLWLEDGSKVTSWEYPGFIHFFALSHDGEYLVMPVADIKEGWSIFSGKTKFNIPGSAAVVVKLKDGAEIARVNFPNPLSSLAFSPDGGFLVGGLVDGSAHVFGVEDGREVARLDHGSSINKVLFSPRQTFIATAGKDRFVRLWLWRNEDLIEEACSRLTRNFTVEEWKRWFGENPYQLTCGDLPPHTSLIEEGQERAYMGDVDGATAIFESVIELGDSINRDPRGWARELAADGLIEKGVKWAKSGAITVAVEAFSQAQQLNPAIEISLVDWNELCWQGVLRSMPGDVMHACDRAIELAPDNGGAKDSRGLARALTGDYRGAIEDFEAYVKWGVDQRPEEVILMRQSWIRELKAGRNPIDSSTLEMLLRQ